MTTLEPTPKAALERLVAEAVKAERTRILGVARDVLPAAEYNALVKTLAGWPAPDRSGGRR